MFSWRYEVRRLPALQGAVGKANGKVSAKVDALSAVRSKKVVS
jgi:hypothetical protein